MKSFKGIIQNDVKEWSEKRRYKIGQLVSFSGATYQNATGMNSNPTDNTDWIRQTSGLAGFNTIIQWNGTDTVTVPLGYSGTLWNMSRSNFSTYSVVGTDLTITGGTAEAGDIIQFTSN